LATARLIRYDKEVDTKPKRGLKLKRTDNMGLVVISLRFNHKLTSKVWSRESGVLVRKLKQINNFPMSSAKTRYREEFRRLKDAITLVVLLK
jgi:hypothetical protein